MSTTVRPTASFDVPQGAFAGDVPLVANVRGGHVSAVHRGIAAVVAADGTEQVALGDTSQGAFLRSSAKPFQTMPAVLSGGIDRFGITERELAVLCASHIAQSHHTEAVLCVLEKAGLGEDALQCGTHPPIHQATARKRLEAGQDPSPVCNNCSGVHTGMLIACRASGWPLDNYGDPDHPLQRWIREILGAFSGVEPESMEYGIDNCAIPTWRLPIHNAALAFARLASGSHISSDLAAGAHRISAAMTHHPDMVGGEGRFDTVLMEAAGCALVSKGGAEGFQGIGVVDSGTGLAIKITDGGSATSPVALRLLSRLGAIDGDAMRRLEAFVEPKIRNHQHTLVGHFAAVFDLEPAP
jgi:L-asparaginase II